jgi:hypothetical protein
LKRTFFLRRVDFVVAAFLVVLRIHQRLVLAALFSSARIIVAAADRQCE